MQLLLVFSQGQRATFLELIYDQHRHADFPSLAGGPANCIGVEKFEVVDPTPSSAERKYAKDSSPGLETSGKEAFAASDSDEA